MGTVQCIIGVVLEAHKDPSLHAPILHARPYDKRAKWPHNDPPEP